MDRDYVATREEVEMLCGTIVENKGSHGKVTFTCRSAQTHDADFMDRDDTECGDLSAVNLNEHRLDISKPMIQTLSSSYRDMRAVSWK